VSRIQVIGLGQRFRSDDGAGPRVIDRLAESGLEGPEYRECQGDAAALLELFREREQVIVVDAVCSSRDVDGTIYEVDGLREDLPVEASRASSHVLGLGEALALGRVLGHMPAKLTIYGIVGSRFEPGEELGPAVNDAVEQVVESIIGYCTREQTACTNTP